MSINGDDIMVRKSKLIGQTINNFYVLDSFHIKNDTRLQVRCENCKTIQEKNRRSILNSKCECDNCGNGRKRRNANGYYGTPIYTRYMEILSRLKEWNELKGLIQSSVFNSWIF